MVGVHDNYLSAVPNTAVAKSQQQRPNPRWYGGKGSCVNFVKFSMSPNGLFCVSTLNLISGGPQGSIIFYDLLQFDAI